MHDFDKAIRDLFIALFVVGAIAGSGVAALVGYLLKRWGYL